MKTSTRIVLVLLVLLAAGLAALSIASTLLASEAAMTHDQYLHMCAARDALWLCVLLVQIPVVWSASGAFGTKWSLAAAPLSAVGSMLCSFGGGFLLFLASEQAWSHAAERLRDLL